MIVVPCPFGIVQIVTESFDDGFILSDLVRTLFVGVILVAERIVPEFDIAVMGAVRFASFIVYASVVFAYFVKIDRIRIAKPCTSIILFCVYFVNYICGISYYF